MSDIEAGIRLAFGNTFRIELCLLRAAIPVPSDYNHDFVLGFELRVEVPQPA